MDHFTDNTKDARYELEENGHVAYATYRRENGVLMIDYVYAPPELRGSGVAARLMKQVMAAAKEDALHVHPVCGYAQAWLQKNIADYNTMVQW